MSAFQNLFYFEFYHSCLTFATDVKDVESDKKKISLALKTDAILNEKDTAL